MKNRPLTDTECGMAAQIAVMRDRNEEGIYVKIYKKSSEFLISFTIEKMTNNDFCEAVIENKIQIHGNDFPIFFESAKERELYESRI